MTTSLSDKAAARMAVVEEHVRCENAHDLDGVMRTFGSEAQYDDSPWNERHLGKDGVRSYYAQLMEIMPDLSIDVQRKHITEDGIVLEVIIRGTHRAAWRGLPATGARLRIPLCAFYTFDEQNRLTGERLYYDRATVLAQLGVFHEPQSFLGRITTIVTHPFTIGRIAARKLFGR